MDINKEQQEILFKLSMFEQQARILQQQLQAVEENIVDLKSLDFGLEELKGSTKREILATIGRGIFIKARILSEDLTVDIGGRNLVKKSIAETRKIIKEQAEKLQNIKKSLEEKIEGISNEIEKLIFEAQKKEES